jgi:hypothetical protein
MNYTGIHSLLMHDGCPHLALKITFGDGVRLLIQD